MQSLDHSLCVNCILYLTPVQGLNYFHVVKVTEILKETEEDGVKNVFGQFSSQRMKVSTCNRCCCGITYNGCEEICLFSVVCMQMWLEIQKQYEKQSIYLGVLCKGF